MLIAASKRVTWTVVSPWGTHGKLPSNYENIATRFGVPFMDVVQDSLIEIPAIQHTTCCAKLFEFPSVFCIFPWLPFLIQFIPFIVLGIVQLVFSFCRNQLASCSIFRRTNKVFPWKLDIFFSKKEMAKILMWFYIRWRKWKYKCQSSF